MMHVPLGDTYEVLFTTRRFSSGAPFTLAGTPALSVYEEANLTQITAGVSVSADYDSVTGLNQAAVVASGANGYEVGKYYSIVITTGTVDSVSVVGEVVGHFRVMPAEDAGAGIPDVNMTHVADSATSTATAQLGVNVVQAAGTAWGSGAITAASIATDAIGAAELAADAVTEIQSGLATEANQTTILARLGSWTGTGVNNILGAFQALMRSDATAVSDIGGTYDDGTDSLQAIRDHIGDGTNLTEAGGTGNHLTAVPSVGTVTGNVDGNVGGNVTGSVGSLATQAKADVNAEVVDVMDTDTISLPGQTAPPNAPTRTQALGWLYKAFRNKKDNDGSTTNLYADDGTTVDSKQSTSEAGGTVTKAEWVTGP